MAAFPIPETARSGLRKVARSGGELLTVLPPVWLDDVAEAVIAAADWDFERPAQMLDRALPALGGLGADAGRRSIVAALCLSLPDRVTALQLPPSILTLYPAAVTRLSFELQHEGPYDPDHYAKDVRFVLGVTIPVGGQIADIGYSEAAPAVLGRVRRALANSGRLALAGDAAGLGAYIGANPLRPYLQMHTEARDLANFNPDGWDRAYGRVAEVLGQRPEYGGLIGLSWFYDPQVAAISPRLAYLAERQLAGGAVRIRLGSSPLQVELATSKSESRRQAYEQGRYQPRCYAIVWPRAKLLAWAEADRPLARPKDRGGQAA